MPKRAWLPCGKNYNSSEKRTSRFVLPDTTRGFRSTNFAPMCNHTNLVACEQAICGRKLPGHRVSVARAVGSGTTLSSVVDHARLFVASRVVSLGLVKHVFTVSSNH